MKNKFTVENTAMLLIDHQQGTIKLARNLSREEIVQNTRALARVAVETEMSLVLTSSMEDHFQGLLLDDLQKIAPEAYSNRIKRPGVVDCWEYDEYRNAVIATGKKKLIMAGLTNDVCIVYPAISAIEAGFEVQVVVDAGGSPTTLADETALRRMEKHGVTLTSTNQVMAELANSWSEGVGQTIQTVMYQEILSKFLEA
ncbi:MAG TPA: isochorismatase family protein [Thermosynechococcaceae cyanobacterium]|jgi:nicotinamidase-related amidase